jgi:hypothetical protein
MVLSFNSINISGGPFFFFLLVHLFYVVIKRDAPFSLGGDL